MMATPNQAERRNVHIVLFFFPLTKEQLLEGYRRWMYCTEDVLIQPYERFENSLIDTICIT